MNLQVLTNSRPTQDLGAEFVVSCTSGNLKISPDFAKAIGVVPGDNMAVAKDADGNFFAFKGGDGVGNKLAKSGSYFSMSSQNTWNSLEGDEDLNRVFEIDGEVIEEDGVQYAKLVHARDEQKTPRSSSSSDDADRAEPQAGPQEEAPQEEEGFEAI